MRYPVILDMLADGALNLTGVRLLAPHLTDDNHVAVLESARGLKTPDVERLVAGLAPQADVPTTIRKIPVPRSSTAEARPESCGSLPAPPGLPSSQDSMDGPTPAPQPFTQASAQPLTPQPTTPQPPTPPPRTQTPVARSVVQPLSPGRYKMQLTISGTTLEKFELAKDLLRHAVPSGDADAIFDRALTLLLTELAKRKFAATNRPRRGQKGTVQPDGAPSRYISADVRRAVYLRDLGRCAFVSGDGRRCDARAFVEFHHLKPHGEGGPPTEANIELRCQLCRARHNRHYADCRIMPTDLRWVAMGAVEGRTRAA